MAEMEICGKLSPTIHLFYPREVNMGDGIGGPVVRCVAGNAFELDVTHYRKDNQEQYSRIEKIIIGKIDNPENPEYRETTQEELEQALKGKFVSCNVQYRDEKTDALVCNVFVQKPPEGF
tara:strand:- start:324 stop:683 length:360 start_codon:yes stop_codon:yes gene_type:complete